MIIYSIHLLWQEEGCSVSYHSEYVHRSICIHLSPTLHFRLAKAGNIFILFAQHLPQYDSRILKGYPDKSALTSMLLLSDFHGFKTTARTVVLIVFFLHTNIADRLECDTGHIYIRKHRSTTGTDLWNANIWADGYVSSFSAQGFRLALNWPYRLCAYQCLEHTSCA